MDPSVHAPQDHQLQGRHAQKYHGICISDIHNNSILDDNSDNNDNKYI